MMMNAELTADTAERALRPRGRCSEPDKRRRPARSDGETDVRRCRLLDQWQHGGQCKRSGRAAPACRAGANGYADPRSGRDATLDRRGPQLRTIAPAEVMASPAVAQPGSTE